MGNVKFIAITRKKIVQYAISVLITLSVIYANVTYFSVLSPANYSFFKFLSYDAWSETEEYSAGGKLAIVVEDFGNDRRGVKEMMSINRHLTFGVLPFEPYSYIDAKTAHNSGFEVIIHLPAGLKNMKKEKSVSNRTPINSSQDDGEIFEKVLDSFESVPYAAGMNLHFLSKKGLDERVIKNLLFTIKDKNAYFIDNKSSSSTDIKKIASNIGVIYYGNDVTIDITKSKSHMKNSLRNAGDIALKQGKAVAACRVGNTGSAAAAEAIKEMLPEFDKRNIELVFISELDF